MNAIVKGQIVTTREESLIYECIIAFYVDNKNQSITNRVKALLKECEIEEYCFSGEAFILDHKDWGLGDIVKRGYLFGRI